MMRPRSNEADVDDAVPPAIRRSPRAALEAQKLQTQQPQHYTYDDSDESPDEATPPPIPRSRSNSVNSEQARSVNSHDDYSLDVNPLRVHPVDAPATIKPGHKFSYPLREPVESHDSAPPPAPPVPQPRRRSRGLISYRTNKKLPLHLRRQPSLETINSVTTTTSEDYQDPPEAEAPSPDWFTVEHDPPVTPAPTSATSKPSSTNSSTGSSRQSTTPVETPLEFASLDHHTPQSLFRKMMPRKIDDPPRSPSRLVIERRVSFDRTSHPSTLSKSTTSLPQDRHVDPISYSLDRRPSKSSSEWSASSFDTSSLTEAEIKKCKKKGINPALYAEMRAAKKGKWTSPIAGNTFL